jgi:hypothetical protein
MGVTITSTAADVVEGGRGAALIAADGVDPIEGMGKTEALLRQLPMAVYFCKMKKRDFNFIRVGERSSPTLITFQTRIKPPFGRFYSRFQF